MEFVLGIVFFTLTIGGGATLLYATWRNWSWLVDPPERFVLVYSHSFIKRVFGSAVLRLYNYVLGAALVLAGLLMLWNEWFRI